MAEIFGLAAGVLQVASFGADASEATARCLSSVGTLLDDPETKVLHTAKLYEDTLAVSKGCNDVFMELDKAVKKFNEGGAKMSVLARLQWPLDSTKLTEPLKVLKNYNDVLHLMLAVLQIVEGRRAATSEELQALGNSLQRLTLSNESLAQSNKTLTDILYLQQQSPDGKVNHAHTSTPSSTQTRSLDATEANGSPFISMHALQEPPLLDSAEPVRPYDPMQNHLQRCMDSVQELAKTIACAMNA